MIIAATVICSLEIFGLETKRKIEQLEQGRSSTRNTSGWRETARHGHSESAYGWTIGGISARPTEPKSQLNPLERSVVV